MPVVEIKFTLPEEWNEFYETIHAGDAFRDLRETHHWLSELCNNGEVHNYNSVRLSEEIIQRLSKTISIVDFE